MMTRENKTRLKCGDCANWRRPKDGQTGVCFLQPVLSGNTTAVILEAADGGTIQINSVAKGGYLAMDSDDMACAQFVYAW